MSTRCNIKLVPVDATGHTQPDGIIWLYHHHDGYPEGVGSELKYQMMMRAPGDVWTAATHLLQCKVRMYDGTSIAGCNKFQLTSGQHGDIDYLYEIYIGERHRWNDLPCAPRIRCYQRIRERDGSSWLQEISLDGVTPVWYPNKED